MKNFFFVFFAIFINQILFSQLNNKQIDSILLYTNKELIKKNIPRKEIIDWNFKILELSKRRNYNRGIVHSNINIANHYFNLGETDKSLYYLEIAKDLCLSSKLDNYTTSRIFQEYSQVFYSIGSYELSLENNSKAIYYGKKIESLEMKNKLLSYIYSTRGINFYKNEMIDSSLFYLQKSNFHHRTPYILSTIANHYIEFQPNLDSAKFYLKNSKELYNKKKHKYTNNDISVVYFYYGKLFLKQKKYELALKNFEKSLDYCKNLKNTNHTLNLYDKLIFCYKKTKDFKKEAEYLEKYKILKDSNSQNLSKSFDISHKIKEKEKKETELELKNRIIYLTFISFFLIFSLLFYLNVRKKREKALLFKNKEEIFEKEEETKELRKRIVNAIVSDEIIKLAIDNDINFLVKFKELNPEFISKLLEINNNLSQSDLVFCAYIWLGFTSKDIANYTFMQHRSVQTKKYRLRRKLNLPPETNLYNYFRSLSAV